MKRFFALFLILTLFSVPICVKGETEAVYSADFESGSLSGWQMLNGVFEASKERPYEGCGKGELLRDCPGFDLARHKLYGQLLRKRRRRRGWYLSGAEAGIF